MYIKMKRSKKLLIFLSSFMLCVGVSCHRNNQYLAQVDIKKSLAAVGNHSQAGENKNWMISITKEFRNKFDVRLIHKFLLENYVYFLTTERKSTTPGSPYISKIKRMCITPGKSIADEYSEILVECGGMNGTYNLVQTAHVGNPGLKLMKSLKIGPKDKVLFATFSKSKTTNSKESTADSAICIYSLDAINKKFTEKIRNCFGNVANSELNFVLNEKKCVGTISTINIDTECIRGVKNTSFNGNEHIISSPFSTFTAFPTAIISARRENRTIICIITRDGYLKTFIVNDTKSLIYMYTDLNVGKNVNFDLQQSSDELIVFTTVDDISRVYRGTKIPCGIFGTYDTCLQSDVKSCGWCVSSNQCTKNFECEQNQNYEMWLNYDFRKETKIIHINSLSFERTSDKIIEMTIEKIPSIFKQFNCSFEIGNEIYTTSLFRLDQTNAICHTPSANKISRIPLDYDYFKATLRIETNYIPNIASINITFFDNDYISRKLCLKSQPPSISSIKPVEGPWEGGTNLTILGENLGCTFEDISRSIIKVAGIPCIPLIENCIPMKMIVCNIDGSSPQENLEGPVELWLNQRYFKSQQNFKFANSKINNVSPNQGFIYGGTVLIFKGEHLDAGRLVEISVGNTSCMLISRSPNEIKCITGPSAIENKVEIIVKFDNNIRKPYNSSFKYEKDAERDENGFNTAPKGILSGGIEILIRNITFTSITSIKELQFIVHINGTDHNSFCTVRNDSTATCLSPHIPNIDHSSFSANNPLGLEFSLKHQPENVEINFNTYNESTKFTLYPDPEFSHFYSSSVEFNDKIYVIIEGRNVNSACQKQDIKVKVGNDNCTVISLSSHQVVCFLPKSQLANEGYDTLAEHENITAMPKSQRFNSIDKFEEEYDILAKHEFITVMIGNKLIKSVPKLKSPEAVPSIIIYGVIGILCIIALLLFIYHFYYRRNTSVKNLLVLKKMQQHMNKMCMQSIVLKQTIKQVIIEKQIDLDDDLSNILKLPNISIIVDNEYSRPTAKISAETEYLLPFDGKWEFPRENLYLGNDLGEGEFGKVVQAEALGILQKNVVTTVAVKMLKDNHSDEDMIDLVSEMELMKLIGAHVNVLQLLGCCSQDGELLIITEFALHGNLRDFLRDSLPSAKNKHGFKLSQNTLLMFAQQAAKGMEYLAAKKCVHRDLAARNVLVSNNYIIKIADFGLARDIRNKDYYRKETKDRLPVKWMAPEALGHDLYSTQSDVWSYGILLWEILTLGATPYPSFPDLGKLFLALHSGYRMEKPPNCSVKLYSLMHKCWSYIPEDRPSFTMIANALEDILSKNADDEVFQRCNVYWPQRHECSSNDVENPADLLHE